MEILETIKSTGYATEKELYKREELDKMKEALQELVKKQLLEPVTKNLLYFSSHGLKKPYLKIFNKPNISWILSPSECC